MTTTQIPTDSQINAAMDDFTALWNAAVERYGDKAADALTILINDSRKGR